MSRLNLIHLFDFYLAVIFLCSSAVRWQQYRHVLALVHAVPGRWPRLFQLVKQHSTIFLTWATVLPAVLAFSLSAMHMLACRLIWPQADLTVADVLGSWPSLLLLGVLGLTMVGVDGYAMFNYGEINREQVQKYFDQAEYWLRSWTAPVVRIVTFGYVNPRKMVAVEVQKALIEASRLLNSTFWWVTVQTGLRVLFGLALWLSFAVRAFR